MFNIRLIQKTDNKMTAHLIRTVMTEYGACGAGFSIQDPEVDAMFENYHRAGHFYFVIEQDKKIVGGAGIGPLVGSTDTKICELKKMYFFPELRGKGLGSKLLALLLQKAKESGYDKCYLETLNSMNEAQVLYQKFDFKKLSKPMGNTGHFGCDAWYLRAL
ncbi:MAG: GNAT family N-acetyltransferase [Bacteriovoracaceae bacterium]|nr:GNAT family N-acetyltransferase [Bacteriovoracaceae bacterium]